MTIPQKRQRVHVTRLPERRLPEGGQKPKALGDLMRELSENPPTRKTKTDE
ncbi:MAG: hypothetical protein AAFR64_14065 [Pseudomonadota bacterium]